MDIHKYNYTGFVSDVFLPTFVVCFLTCVFVYFSIGFKYKTHANIMPTSYQKHPKLIPKSPQH